MKAIITFREAINTGSGVTKVVQASQCDIISDGHVVKFVMMNGDEGIVPMRNVCAIIYKA